MIYQFDNPDNKEVSASKLIQPSTKQKFPGDQNMYPSLEKRLKDCVSHITSANQLEPKTQLHVLCPHVNPKALYVGAIKSQ